MRARAERPPPHFRNSRGKALDGDRTYRLTATHTIGNWNPLFAGRQDEGVGKVPKPGHLVADYLKNGEEPAPDDSAEYDLSEGLTRDVSRPFYFVAMSQTWMRMPRRNVSRAHSGRGREHDLM